MQAQPATPRPSPIRWLRALLATLALATLAACTQTLDTDVTRFASQLPHPAGQSFTVVAGDPALAGGIEFGQYAALVSAQLAKQGYTPSPDPASAALVVRLDYGVDKGRTVVTSSPAPFWGPWHGYHGFGGYGGWGPGWGGGFYPHGPWGWGWYDPWFASNVDSYTAYTSGITLKIDDATGHRLFEGRAEAVSTSNKLSYLVPNLIEAMFTGFPGDSGKTVRITVAPEKDAAKTGK